MQYKPTTLYIASMVDELNEESTRAVYMVVKQLRQLQDSKNKIS